MIPAFQRSYTTPEIPQLFARIISRHNLRISFIIQWSRWRRQHQFSAATAHRKTRRNVQL